MSEKLCLQWNQFQDNVKKAFGNLRESTDFADVTLACEDGHQIEAHKVILAASSQFFQNILKNSKHSHPLIFMRGVKADELAAMVDFMYYGEANVYRQNLASFLVISEELQLQGLKSPDDEGELNEVEDVEQQTKPAAALGSKQTYKRDQIRPNTKTPRKESKISRDPKTKLKIEDIATPLSFSVDLQQLEETVKPVKSQNLISNSKSCQKVSIPCNFCDEMFGSSQNKIRFKTINGLKKHLSRYHKEH